MASSTGSFQQKFTVSSINYVGIPTAESVWNQFDEQGLILTLKRIQGESNVAYRNRLFDVLVHQANSTYTGLVYGLTREMGLDLFYPVWISPKLLPNGSTIAQDPYIEFDHTRMMLYNNYGQDKVDLEIDRWVRGGNYEHLGQLVNCINTYSSYFTATLLDSDYEWTRSMCILNQTNRKQNIMPVERSSKWQLPHKHLLRGTVRFYNDSVTYLNKVNAAVDINKLGDYHVDYINGVVSSYSIPTQQTEIEYKYVDNPWKPIASPLIISSISNDNFKKAMYEQIVLDDGTGLTHGLATVLGVEILNELLSVQPMYVGE